MRIRENHPIYAVVLSIENSARCHVGTAGEKKKRTEQRTRRAGRVTKKK